MEWITEYEIACIQLSPRMFLPTPGKKDPIIKQNLSRAFDLMDGVADYSSGTVRLFVLPEYSLNGMVDGMFQSKTLKDWLDISVPIPGEYTDMMGEKAAELNCYIAANMCEIHDDWPGRFFNTSFIVSPHKEVILKHWKNNNNSWVIPYTTPSDIYSEFVERYGRKELFPVVTTPIGKLGCITCGEVVYPENARCTAFNGAEIIAHITCAVDFVVG